MTEQVIEITKSILAEAFNRTADEIELDSTIGTSPYWDSLGHMRLILLIEEKYSVELSPDQILELRSFKAINSLLSNLM